jgi:hypothetical protein
VPSLLDQFQSFRSSSGTGSVTPQPEVVLTITLSSLINFGPRVDYRLLFDELVIDKQIGFTPRKVNRWLTANPCKASVPDAD